MTKEEYVKFYQEHGFRNDDYGLQFLDTKLYDKLKDSSDLKDRNKADSMKASSRVQFWSWFSCAPRTEDEIRRQLVSNPDSICYSYICKYSTLSEDFIEELSYATNLLMQKTITSQREIARKKDLLDWANICQHQVLSIEFMDRHIDQLHPHWTAACQTLSVDFLKKHWKAFALTDLWGLQRDLIATDADLYALIRKNYFVQNELNKENAAKAREAQRIKRRNTKKKEVW